jgi:hypothetical protein
MSIEPGADHLRCNSGGGMATSACRRFRRALACDEKRKEEPMSGLFGDHDNAVERLKRAGIAADKTIFTAPEMRADDETDHAGGLLFDPRPLGGEPKSFVKRSDEIVDDPRKFVPTPDQTVKERFPNDLKPATDARELGVEKLKYKAWLKKMGVDVDDDDLERWLGRKADDNKTESQKRREGSIERLLRQYEEMMRRQLQGPHDNLESGNWRRPRPRDI